MHYGIASFALALTIVAAPAGAQTFSNASQILIPDNGSTSSAIDVSGLQGTISGLSLTLNGVNHSYAQDLVFGLVAEDLGLGLVFWSGAGGSNAINNATVSFSDSASDFLPFPLFDLGPVTSGSYLPSNWFAYGIDGVTNAVTFADFNGLNANGRWNLLAFDVLPGDTGSVNGGWSLAFTTTGSGTPGAVPEPAAWAMLIGGFALAGGALRRRRNTAVRVTFA